MNLVSGSHSGKRGLTPESSPLMSQRPTVADQPGTHVLNDKKWNWKKKTYKKHLRGHLMKFQYKDSSSEQYRQGMENSSFRPHMDCILDAPFPQKGDMILDNKIFFFFLAWDNCYQDEQLRIPAGRTPSAAAVCHSLLKGHLGSASDPTDLPFSSLRSGILSNVTNCSIQCPSTLSTDFRFQDFNRV